MASTSPIASRPWQEVYRDLRNRIDAGELAPGAGLPTLAALATERALTTHGARRVMERLRDEGRVDSWPGFGYRVSPPRVAYRIDKQPSFSKTLSRSSRNGSTRLIGSRTVALPADLARDMRVRTGTRVLQTELVRSINGVDAVIAHNHFPLPRFAGIEATLASTGSVSLALAAKGVARYERRATRIGARMPSGHEALLLGIPRSQPVVVTVGINVDESGDPVEVSQSISRADCVSLEV